MNELNPYSAPVARIADEPAAGTLVLAEPHTRLWAYLVDSLLFVLIFLIGAVVGGIFMGAAAMPESDYDPSSSAPFMEMIAPVLLVAGGAVFLWAIYNFVLLYRHGQTVGKRIFGIRIVRSDGRRASFPRLFFLRILVNGILQGLPFGLGLLYWLIDSLFIVRTDRRCIHDHIADTIVINA